MPHYRWTGINLFGDLVHGKSFARSQEKLDAMLFGHEIALLRVTTCYWQHWKLSLRDKIQFFRHLSTLLGAGVRVSDGITIVAASFNNDVQEIIIDIGNAVQEGSPLAKALSYHNELIDKHILPLVAAGENSGQLALGLERVAFYLESIQLLQNRLQKAIAMPLISFIFFLAMACISVIGIVPRFQNLFSSLDKPLPWSTHLVFAINDWLYSQYFLLFIAIIGLVIIVLWLLRKRPRWRLWYDWIILSTPFFGTILYNRDMMVFLQTLSLLLEGGVHLAQALSPSMEALHNFIIYQQFAKLKTEVIAGRLLSDALYEICQSRELSGLVAIGESSGTLALMVRQASLLYRERVYAHLDLLTTLIQPILLIGMGVLIALLIMVIYTPLLTLSHALF